MSRRETHRLDVVPECAVAACLDQLPWPEDGVPPIPPERSFVYEFADSNYPKVRVHFRATECADGKAWRWSCLNEVVGDAEYRP